MSPSGALPPFEVVRVQAPADHQRYRVLVDRLWPRGISRDAASLDEWAKDLAPSTELRRWYGHDPARFIEFARRYHDELHRAPAIDALARLRAVAADRPVALLTATRDVEHSGARVLCDLLRAKSKMKERKAP